MFDQLSDASKGAVFLVSGISIFGFSDNLTLLVSDTVSVGQFHFSRSLIAIFMVIVAARLFGMPVLAKLWKPIAARTVFMVTSMLLYFGAMPMMPIAEAGAGLFTSPIFVLLFSAILFGERIGFAAYWRLVGSVGLVRLQPGAEGVTVIKLCLFWRGPTQSGLLSPFAICRMKARLRFCSAFWSPLGSAVQ